MPAILTRAKREGGGVAFGEGWCASGLRECESEYAVNGSVIRNGEPEPVQLMPQMYSFNTGSDQHGHPYLILNIHTENLGLFLVPLVPAAARQLGLKLVEFRAAQRGMTGVPALPEDVEWDVPATRGPWAITGTFDGCIVRAARDCSHRP